MYKNNIYLENIYHVMNHLSNHVKKMEYLVNSNKKEHIICQHNIY